MKFGGSAHDGSKALGVRAQEALLAELLAPKAPVSKPAGVPPAARARIAKALSNGAAQGLSTMYARTTASIVAAVLKRLDGDPKALKGLPGLDELSDLIETAIVKPPKASKTGAAS